MRGLVAPNPCSVGSAEDLPGSIRPRYQTAKLKRRESLDPVSLLWERRGQKIDDEAHGGLGGASARVSVRRDLHDIQADQPSLTGDALQELVQLGKAQAVRLDGPRPRRDARVQHVDVERDVD